MLEFVVSWEFWLIVAAVCIVLELLTNTFAMFAIAGGSLVALVLSCFECSMVAQLIGLCIGSILTFICFKSLIRKHIQSTETAEYKTNIDTLIGCEVFAFEKSNESGVARVKIDGDNWQVRTYNYDKISKGDRLRIVNRDSIVLIAEKI